MAAEVSSLELWMSEKQLWSRESQQWLCDEGGAGRVPFCHRDISILTYTVVARGVPAVSLMAHTCEVPDSVLTSSTRTARVDCCVALVLI